MREIRLSLLNCALLAAVVAPAACQREGSEQAAAVTQVSAQVPELAAPGSMGALPAAPNRASLAPAQPTLLLSAGSPAPDVTFALGDGSTLRLRDLQETAVVYFYPKDDTAGCTLEAQEFTELERAFRAAEARVFGVSTQGQASHADFSKKYALTVSLVPDEQGAIARAFGVPIQEGRAKRVTFVVGRDHRILRVFETVTPRGHAEEVLTLVKSASGS
jgi:peroxiredoxin Q/BCP